MLVMGIDPGLGTTGYALVECGSGSMRLVEAGVIRTKPAHSLERRLVDLAEGVGQVIDEFHPEVLAVEELYSHYAHPKTAVIMGHARGVFFLVAGKAGMAVYSYSATRIKKSLTGAGHASKDQVARMLANMMNLDTTAGPADVTDAIATAVCHIRTVSHGGFR
jgi:crossover junction endodeoxyribonuclease RuvC